MTTNKITFSFGENWKNYLRTIDDHDIQSAVQDILEWIPAEQIAGRIVADIGCGSGIHSYCFYMQKPDGLVSVDVDQYSVEATNILRKRAGDPSNWVVSTNSILDAEFLNKAGVFDIVYSWGVLHHTGNMWKAIENASSLVKPSGLFWISLYAKGPKYEKDLQIKQKYNNFSNSGKKLFIYKKIVKLMWKRMKKGQNPLTWNEKVIRGMHKYHDIVDWYGGLPYEVASRSEVESFLGQRGFELVRVKEATERACSVYLFRKVIVTD